MAALPNFRVPAPNLAPGTYDGAYAAQGLRTSNPFQAAQLWENRHPAQTQSGNAPDWVSQALTAALGGVHPQGGANLINPNMLLLHLLGNQPQPPAPPNVAPAASGIDAATGSQSQNIQDDGQQILQHPGVNGPIHPAQLHQMMAALAQQVRAGRVSRAANRIPTTRPAAPTAY